MLQNCSNSFHLSINFVTVIPTFPVYVFQFKMLYLLANSRKSLQYLGYLITLSKFVRIECHVR